MGGDERLIRLKRTAMLLQKQARRLIDAQGGVVCIQGVEAESSPARSCSARSGLVTYVQHTPPYRSRAQRFKSGISTLLRRPHRARVILKRFCLIFYNSF